jgi:hypothetical protein
MYEFSKQVLQKVSFDRSLFSKELRKAIKWIKQEEAILLKTWCLATFGHYREDIIDAFDPQFA